MFQAYPAHLQEVHVVIVYMQHLVSSLSAGDYLVHRLRTCFLTGAPADSDNTTGCIYTQLRRGPPDDELGMLETCRGF